MSAGAGRFERTVYLTAVAYLMAGGYTLLHRRHVIVDIVYAGLSRPARLYLDLLTFILFALYMGALIWFGWHFAWTSFQQGETTGTLWSPPIWPVKFAIPFAGALLLLQGLANLIRDVRAVMHHHRGQEWHGTRRMP
jgi:TRAP-type mannitol/chloroaromatic compound transport system permease small subunit